MGTHSYPLLDALEEELNKPNKMEMEETAIHTLRILMKSPYASKNLNSLLLNFLDDRLP